MLPTAIVSLYAVKLQLIFENVKSVFTGDVGGLGKPKTLMYVRFRQA